MAEWVNNIITWSGWNSLGFLASLIGALVTIHFAKKASTSAASASSAAKDAAKQARNTLIITDSVGDLQKLESLIINMKTDLAKSNWESCAQTCSESYLISSRAKEKLALNWETDEIKLIERINSQVLKLEGEFRRAFEKQQKSSTADMQILLTTLAGDCGKVSEILKGKNHVIKH